MKQEYKTLGYQNNSSGNQSGDQRVIDPHGIGVHGIAHQQVPTYSVFVGEGEFNDDVHHSVGLNSNMNSSA